MAQQQRRGKPPQGERRTIRGAVAGRDGQVEEFNAQRADLEQRARRAEGWLARVVPSHVNADQIIALGIGALRADHNLAEAAIASPESFMAALSECARLGLVPGESYHLLPFNNKRQDGAGNDYWTAEITGVVDYKGEIDLIYRAGGVAAVHAHVVRENDQFRWWPNEMELPWHRLGPPGRDDGLLDESERGPLHGAYAYCRLTAGGYSQPTVMPRSEIMRHKAAAKSKKFWDGPWEPAMWRKTPLHAQYDIVPKSPEFLRQRLQAQQVLQDQGYRVPPSEYVAVGASPSAALPAPPAPGPRQAPFDRAKALKRLHAMLTEAKITDRDMKLRLAGMLANPAGAPLWLESSSDLDDGQIRTALATFDRITTEAETQGKDVYEVLCAIDERLATAQGNDDPPDAEGEDPGEPA